MDTNAPLLRGKTLSICLAGLVCMAVLAACDGDGVFLPTIVERPALSVRITKVSAYQTHETVLFVADPVEGEPDDESPVAEATLLANRPTLIRAMVEPVDGLALGEITGRLKLRTTPSEDEMVFESKAFVFTPSRPGNLSSSLTWTIDAAFITAATTLRVGLFESRIETLSADDAVVVDAPESRWPASGRARLRPEAAPLLTVHLVPIVAAANESEFDAPQIPEATPEITERIRAKAMELLPISDIAFIVHAPMDLTTPIDAYGEGWDVGLAALDARRQAAGDDEIYIGLLAPTERRGDFCPLSCLQGKTHLLEGSEDNQPTFTPTAFVLTYDDDTSASTFVHEIGHTLGRKHAPCDVDDTMVDLDYPHEDAKIGSWGWSSATGSLRPPTDRDFMSYCAPQWVSPYQTGHLLRALRAFEE